MGKPVRYARRLAVGLMGAVIVAGCCFATVGWSPDSKSVILPVFGHQRIDRLVMVGLDGKAIRDVARVGAPGETLCPAAWSPDGKWIAYFKFRGLKAEARGNGGTLDASLKIQDAATGRQRTLRRWTKIPKGPSGAPHPNLGRAPQWTADSKHLAVATMLSDVPGMVLVNVRTGAQEKVLSLGKAARSETAALSPRGRYLACLAEVGDDEGLVLRLVDVESLKTRQLAPVSQHRSEGSSMHPPPAWSPDGRWLYFARCEMRGDPNKGSEEQRSYLQRVIVETGHVQTVWQDPDCQSIFNVQVSARSGCVVIGYDFDYCWGLPTDGPYGLSILDPRDGKARAIHFTGRDWYNVGTAVSPDGRWVAFTVAGSQGRPHAGVILPVDGGPPRFFVPGPEARAAVNGYLEARVWSTLGTTDYPGELSKAGIDLKRVRTVAEADKACALAGRVAGRGNSPLLREAATWGPVVIYMEIVAHSDPKLRPLFGAQARQKLSAVREAHPEHPLGPALEARLNRLLAPPGPRKIPPRTR